LRVIHRRSLLHSLPKKHFALSFRTKRGISLCFKAKKREISRFSRNDSFPFCAASRSFVTPITRKGSSHHITLLRKVTCCFWIEGTAKGGRHGQTRLSFHGDSHVVPDLLHALGRNAPLPALRRGKGIFLHWEGRRAVRLIHFLFLGET